MFAAARSISLTSRSQARQGRGFAEPQVLAATDAG
jgi:hypothetical protein